MYLTCFKLKRTRLAIGWVSNAYRVHQRLRMAYPVEERLLFRIEEQESSTRILAQSQLPPQIEQAFAEFDVLEGPPQIKQFEYKLEAGATCRFRLLANPTVTRQGKRLGLIKEEDQKQWLERQLQKGGAQLLGCTVLSLGLKRSSRNPAKDERTQTHLAVQFDGVLRVIEPQNLQAVVLNGIGHAKGYGFGLLSLASL